MEGYQGAAPQYYYTTPKVQLADESHVSHDYFASAMNSYVDVARTSDSVHITSASSYDGFGYANYESEYYMPRPTNNTLNFNATSNIQHAPVYSHASAAEQVHMPMNDYQGRTNMVSSANYYETSHASSFCNMQHGVSSFYSSAANSQYVVRPQNMPVNEIIDHANINYPANYSQLPYVAPHATRVEVVPMNSASYINPNYHDSASYVTFNCSRINENSVGVLPPHTQKRAAIIKSEYPVLETGASSVSENGHAQATTQTNNLPVKKYVSTIQGDLARKMGESYGIEYKCKARKYQRPYPVHFDLAPYPFSLPYFVKFSGENSETPWEHVTRYLAQLGEASSVEAFKVRLFDLSLTGAALWWYSSLPPNSVHAWSQLEHQFYYRFRKKQEPLPVNKIGNHEKIDSDMNNGSVINKAEQNVTCSKYIPSQETNLAVKKHVKHKKIAILDFSGAKGVVYLPSEYRVTDKPQSIAERGSASKEHLDDEDQNPKGKGKALEDQSSVLSTTDGKT